MGRYDRNRLYITDKEQEQIKETRILFGGAGIGSIIAECALRLGFEKMTIVDGDKVEESNLNRQNYVASDIGEYKAEILCRRLLEINPRAEISCRKEFINKENVRNIVKGHDIAINALDFQSDIPFVFDQVCSEMNIPVLHPFNFGWAGFLAIVHPQGYKITEISRNFQGFELKIGDFIMRYNSFLNIDDDWLKSVMDKYNEEQNILPPPQLAVASWLVAGQCTNAMFCIVTGKQVRYFPKFYKIYSYET